MFSSEYFWHDTLGRYWYRLVGCRIFGHREVRDITDFDDDGPRLHCFHCEQNIFDHLGRRLSPHELFLFRFKYEKGPDKNLDYGVFQGGGVGNPVLLFKNPKGRRGFIYGSAELHIKHLRREDFALYMDWETTVEGTQFIREFEESGR
jgi:hypothetical protein